VSFDKKPDHKHKKSSRGLSATEDTGPEDSIGTSDISSNKGPEKCNISHNELRKLRPKKSSLWPADTGASSHMAYQPSCFRSLLTPIKRRPIQVRGGVLYAREKGTAVLTCEDGFTIKLSDVLFVPDLGINLLSARRLCQAGLKGNFNSRKMFFKRGEKTIIEAIMSQGLYIVLHVN
jgi:hypothetical protein